MDGLVYGRRASFSCGSGADADDEYGSVMASPKV
jgi:hypothetical protein